jgi:hypothetical protein
VGRGRRTRTTDGHHRDKGDNNPGAHIRHCRITGRRGWRHDQHQPIAEATIRCANADRRCSALESSDSATMLIVLTREDGNHAEPAAETIDLASNRDRRVG